MDWIEQRINPGRAGEVIQQTCAWKQEKQLYFTLAVPYRCLLSNGLT